MFVKETSEGNSTGDSHESIHYNTFVLYVLISDTDVIHLLFPNDVKHNLYR